MIMGEHAVLHGKTAIVAAIDQTITVKLTPRKDDKITLNSQLFGEYQTQLPISTIEKPYNFVLAVIQLYQNHFKSGLDLLIESDIDPQLGLGTSAAVTVSTLQCLAQWTQQSLTKETCHQQAHTIIQQQQGQGSGADAAASCFGGILAYQMDPYQYIPLKYRPPMQLFYAGYKTPTADVIQFVRQRQQQFPQIYQTIYNTMDQCCQHAITAWQAQDWNTVAELMKIHQACQAALGTSDPHLNHMIDKLQSIDGILAAKISGSGLGDCVVALGEPTCRLDDRAILNIVARIKSA